MVLKDVEVGGKISDPTFVPPTVVGILSPELATILSNSGHDFVLAALVRFSISAGLLSSGL